jgi:proteasome accessory factor B
MKILMALSAASRGLTVQELLDVAGDATIRTLYRDLQQLQAAGFALSNDAGSWTIEPKSCISVPLQPAEVVALMMAAQAMGRDGPFAAPLDALRQKLLAMMTPQARAYCRQLSDTTIATTLGTATGRSSSAVVDAARAAIEQEQRLAITHAKPGQPATRRVVEPYATWIADGRAYLIARSEGKTELQHFNLARISQAEVLDETFERDPGFDLDEYVSRGFGALHGPARRVVIELAPDVAHVAREGSYHPTQQVEQLPDGRVHLVMVTGGLSKLAAWIAGFGGKARAIEPTELVALVRETAEGALRASLQ